MDRPTLKVRRPVDLRYTRVFLNGNGNVCAAGTITLVRIGCKPFLLPPMEVKVESSFGFMGRSKNLKGTRQEKYAIQLLHEKLTNMGLRWNHYP